MSIILKIQLVVSNSSSPFIDDGRLYAQSLFDLLGGVCGGSGGGTNRSGCRIESRG